MLGGSREGARLMYLRNTIPQGVGGLGGKSVEGGGGARTAIAFKKKHIR